MHGVCSVDRLRTIDDDAPAPGLQVQDGALALVGVAARQQVPLLANQREEEVVRVIEVDVLGTDALARLQVHDGGQGGGGVRVRERVDGAVGQVHGGSIVILCHTVDSYTYRTTVRRN